MCGDSYPIISRLSLPGLITALTNKNPKNCISQFIDIKHKDPDFFQFILKIIPIDFICETNVETIKHIIQENYRNYIGMNDSFKIALKRRHHEKIQRDSFIENIADIIDNKVDLENPDITIRIEILGNVCGISFLARNDILKVKE
jgi:tRNA(Ser,Leu) C12 N-acetylase TAN1